MPGAMIPSDWDEESWKCWVVQWPDSEQWFAVLNGFITTPKIGRFWDRDTGTITEAQAVGIQIWDRNTPMEESLMSCNEESLTVFNRIADLLEAMLDKPCCPTPAQPGSGGSRGAGTTRAPANPFEDDGDNFPEEAGFDDREEWENHKCNAAWDLINNLTQDLLGLSGITLALTSGVTGWVATIIPILLTPIPFDDIAALAVFLIISALSYGLMAELSVIIGDNRDDLVCVLYNADTALQAQDELVSAIANLIDDNFSDPANSYLHSIIDYMVTFDAVNILYLDVPTVKQDADCSGCGEGCATTAELSNVFGDFTEEPTPGHFILEAESVAGWSCGTAREVAGSFDIPVVLTPNTLSSSTGGDPIGLTKCGTDSVFRFWSGPNWTGSIVYEGDVHSGSETCQSFLILASDAEFVMEFTWCDA